MSGFLSRLVGRAVEPGAAVAPRTRALFEPAQADDDEPQPQIALSHDEGQPKQTWRGPLTAEASDPAISPAPVAAQVAAPATAGPVPRPKSPRSDNEQPGAHTQPARPDDRAASKPVPPSSESVAAMPSVEPRAPRDADPTPPRPRRSDVEPNEIPANTTTMPEPEVLMPTPARNNVDLAPSGPSIVFDDDNGESPLLVPAPAARESGMVRDEPANGERSPELVAAEQPDPQTPILEPLTPAPQIATVETPTVPDQELVVNVSIGRLEVRADVPATPQRQSGPEPPKVMPLEEYLRTRAEERGR